MAAALHRQQAKADDAFERLVYLLGRGAEPGLEQRRRADPAFDGLKRKPRDRNARRQRTVRRTMMPCHSRIATAVSALAGQDGSGG